MRRSVPDPVTGETRHGTVVDIVNTRNPMSHFTLEDGTTLQVQLVVFEVVKVDEPGSNGNPAYTMNSQLVVNARRPEDEGDV